MTTPIDPAGRALLAAILDAPEDDSARLVYADWLEETGGEDERRRAEFVRVQVELARLGNTDPRRDELRQRERELWADLGLHGGELGLVHWLEVPRPKPPAPSGGAGGWALTGGAGGYVPPHILCRRGFPAIARCPLAKWMEVGPTLVAAHPLTRVELSDVKVFASASDQFGYIVSTNDDAQEAWARLLRYQPLGLWYPARDAALDALSFACLMQARGVAPGQGG